MKAGPYPIKEMIYVPVFQRQCASINWRNQTQPRPAKHRGLSASYAVSHVERYTVLWFPVRSASLYHSTSLITPLPPALSAPFKFLSRSLSQHSPPPWFRDHPRKGGAHRATSRPSQVSSSRQNGRRSPHRSLLGNHRSSGWLRHLVLYPAREETPSKPPTSAFSASGVLG